MKKKTQNNNKIYYIITRMQAETGMTYCYY